MKKLLSFVLCTILCFSLIGCSNNTKTSEPTSEPSQKKEKSQEPKLADSLHFVMEKQGIDLNIWRENEKLYVKNNTGKDLSVEIGISMNNEKYTDKNYFYEFKLKGKIKAKDYSEVYTKSNGNKVSAYTSRVQKFDDSDDVTFYPDQFYFDYIKFKVDGMEYGILYHGKTDSYYVCNYTDRDNWETYFISNPKEKIELINQESDNVNTEIKNFTNEQEKKEMKEVYGVDLED